jgi:hypothetical protein
VPFILDAGMVTRKMEFLDGKMIKWFGHYILVAIFVLVAATPD